MSDNLTPTDSLAFLSLDRAPGKRRIRVVNREEILSIQALIGGDVDDDEDDGDFCASQENDDDDTSNDEDASVASDDSNDSSVSDDENAEEEPRSDKEEEDEENSNSTGPIQPLGADISGVSSPAEQCQRDVDTIADDDQEPVVDLDKKICCLCLNYADGEVIQCDSCGLSVHEGCYGLGEDISEISGDSSETTEPWFCEPCLNGRRPKDLHCELCPNKGGAFKRIDYGGGWVHLLCALYVPGCSFGDLELLSPVCLFDVNYAHFGSKSCVACLKQGNRSAARTGVCVKCDVGMCKVYYHVTCAQKCGLLVNALLNTKNVNEQHMAADPYFLCCPAREHSDRQMVKHKMKRFQQLERQMAVAQERSLTPREKRVLAKRKDAHDVFIRSKRPSWMPSKQKWQRLLTTSSKFLEKMAHKAEIVDGITHEEWEGEFRATFTADMVGKFVMPPAFSADFILYFTEREKLLPKIRQRIQELTQINSRQRMAQEELKAGFDKKDQEKKELDDQINEYHDQLSSICTILKHFGCKTIQLPTSIITFPSLSSPINGETPSKSTYATPSGKDSNSIRKSSTSQFEKSKSPASSSRSTSTRKCTDDLVDSVRVRRCAKCQQSRDQHLMTQCDTCNKHYHIFCLEPPLTKLPKKTSLFGWECSRCFEPSNSSDEEIADVDAPRQLRTKRKPVVRFSSDDLFFSFPDSPLNGSLQSSKRKSITKRKNSGDLSAMPSPKRNHQEHADEIRSPSSVIESDHLAMVKEKSQTNMHDRIDNCVNEVASRVLARECHPTGTSTSVVGLEDEKDEDDDNGNGIKAPVYANKHQPKQASSRKGFHDGQKTGLRSANEVMYFRVEDLE